MIDHDVLFLNYSERVKRLAILQPLYSLQSKRLKDIDGNPIDLFEMGLISLLFFFESKLIRNKNTGIEELGEFLFSVLEDRYAIDRKTYQVHARTLIETFRPPNGKRHMKTFHDFESEQIKSVSYSILKAGQSNLHENKQYYELDEDGLELIFATSEYFSEYQISISQMLLRKQLEKGEFISALRQIDEMRLSVNTLKERMVKIKREINRNVTSETVYESYKSLIDDINRRLEIENQEFDALRSFVVETIHRLKNDVKIEKDRLVYEKAINVGRELERVHHEHNELLAESINIKKSALIAAKESLYYVGIESFNFNKEIISRIISEPMSLSKVRELAKPFLRMENTIVWSPLAVFYPQRVISKEQEEHSGEYLNVSDYEQDENHLVEKIYRELMKLCMLHLSSDNTLCLSELIEAVKVTDTKPILESRYFYDFWLTIHQLSPIQLEFDEEDQTHNILVEALHELKNKYRVLSIKEKNAVIKVDEYFSISDMVLTLEELYEL